MTMKGQINIRSYICSQNNGRQILPRKKGRFNRLFVDFLMAFDCGNRDYLIYTLVKNGMHEKMLKLLRDMYSNVMSAVKTKEGFTNHL